MPANPGLLTDFFTGAREVTTDEADVITKIRNLVRGYLHDKAAESKAAKAKKEKKAEIDKLFAELPDDIKVEQPAEATVIDGHTFARTFRSITIDDNVVILKERIDTTLDREKLFEILNNHINRLEVDSQARIEVEHIKSEIYAMMNPHPSSVVSVEKQKKQRSSRSSARPR